MPNGLLNRGTNTGAPSGVYKHMRGHTTHYGRPTGRDNVLREQNGINCLRRRRTDFDSTDSVIRVITHKVYFLGARQYPIFKISTGSLLVANVFQNVYRYWSRLIVIGLLMLCKAIFVTQYVFGYKLGKTLDIVHRKIFRNRIRMKVNGVDTEIQKVYGQQEAGDPYIVVRLSEYIDQHNRSKDRPRYLYTVLN